MRFMVLVPATAESEGGLLPDEQLLAAMGAFNEEMVKAGVLLGGEGLHPTSKGARIHFADGRTTVTHGPFPRPNGLIAGFWLIQVPSKEEAIAWMTRAPFGGDMVLELRQVFEPEDFAPSDPTGELRAQEQRQRAQGAQPPPS